MASLVPVHSLAMLNTFSCAASLNKMLNKQGCGSREPPGMFEPLADGEGGRKSKLGPPPPPPPPVHQAQLPTNPGQTRAKFSFQIHTKDLLVQRLLVAISCSLLAWAPHTPLPPGYSNIGHFGQDGSNRNIWLTTVLFPLLPTCQEV